MNKYTLACLVTISTCISQQLANAGSFEDEFDECQKEQDPLTRLKCFNEISEHTNTTSENPNGNWNRYTSTNPLDDTSTITLSLPSASGTNSHGETITLVLRCESKKTHAYITWDEFLSVNDVIVTTRFDSKNASAQYWRIATNNQSTFHTNPVKFAKHLINSKKFIAQTTPHGENPITATFLTDGLAEAIKPLRAACDW